MKEGKEGGRKGGKEGGGRERDREYIKPFNLGKIIKGKSETVILP